MIFLPIYIIDIVLIYHIIDIVLWYYGDIKNNTNQISPKMLASWNFINGFGAGALGSYSERAVRETEPAFS